MSYIILKIYQKSMMEKLKLKHWTMLISKLKKELLPLF